MHGLTPLKKRRPKHEKMAAPAIYLSVHCLSVAPPAYATTPTDQTRITLSVYPEKRVVPSADHAREMQ